METNIYTEKFECFIRQFEAAGDDEKQQDAVLNSAVEALDLSDRVCCEGFIFALVKEYNNDFMCGFMAMKRLDWFILKNLVRYLLHADKLNSANSFLSLTRSHFYSVWDTVLLTVFDHEEVTFSSEHVYFERVLRGAEEHIESYRKFYSADSFNMEGFRAEREECINDACTVLRDCNPFYDLMLCYDYAATAARRHRKYAKAVSYGYEALNLADKLSAEGMDVRFERAGLLTGLAESLRACGEKGLSDNYFLRAVAALETLANEGTLTARLMLAECQNAYARTQQKKVASHYCQKSIKLLRDFPREIQYISAIFVRAESYKIMARSIGEGDYPLANDHFTNAVRALEEAERLGNSFKLNRRFVELYLEIAELDKLHYKHHDTGVSLFRAYDYAQANVDSFASSDDNSDDRIVRAHYDLGAIYAMLGDNEWGCDLYTCKEDYENSVENLMKAAKIKDLEEVYTALAESYERLARVTATLEDEDEPVTECYKKFVLAYEKNAMTQKTINSYLTAIKAALDAADACPESDRRIFLKKAKKIHDSAAETFGAVYFCHFRIDVDS